MSGPSGGNTSGMANKPKDTRTADTDPERTTSGSPHTVGAPNAGEAKAPRSSTSGAAHETKADEPPAEDADGGDSSS